MADDSHAQNETQTITILPSVTEPSASELVVIPESLKEKGDSEMILNPLADVSPSQNEPERITIIPPVTDPSGSAPVVEPESLKETGDSGEQSTVLVIREKGLIESEASEPVKKVSTNEVRKQKRETEAAVTAGLAATTLTKIRSTPVDGTIILGFGLYSYSEFYYRMGTNSKSRVPETNQIIIPILESNRRDNKVISLFSFVLCLNTRLFV